MEGTTGKQRFLIRFYYNEKLQKETFIRIRKPVLFGADPSCNIRLSKSVKNPIYPVHAIITCKEDLTLWIEMKGPTLINQVPQETNHIKELHLHQLVTLGTQKSASTFELCLPPITALPATASPVATATAPSATATAPSTTATAPSATATTPTKKKKGKADTQPSTHPDEDSIDLFELGDDSQESDISRRSTRSNNSFIATQGDRKRSLSSFYRDLTTITTGRKRMRL